MLEKHFMPEYKPIEALIDHTKEYVQTRVNEAKLAAAEKTTAIIALLAAGATIALLFACCLLFAGVAASIGLGSQRQNHPEHQAVLPSMAHGQ